MRLAPKQPFNFRATLRFILSPPALANGREFQPLLDHWVEGEYRRLADMGGELVLYSVSEAGEEQEGLSVRILKGSRKASTRRAVCNSVRRQFGLDLDLNPYYQLAALDPALARLVERFRGMRIPQALTVYETLISAILEQQINLTFAHKVKRALIEAYGRSLEYQGRIYHCFPKPTALAIATPTELLKLQISGPKARYIIQISRDVRDGCLDLEGLARLRPPLAAARLMELKGVGTWTAQYVGLRALGHLDCLPAADVGLQKAMSYFYGRRQQPNVKWVERKAKAWTGWRSYATFYLWLTYWEAPEWREKLRKQIQCGKRAPQQKTKFTG
jgi:DNA-3-methyladenine glycosylase II